MGESLKSTVIVTSLVVVPAMGVKPRRDDRK
jgi:hypothetical protein